MKPFLLAVMLVVSTLATALAVAAHLEMPRQVPAGDHKLRMSIIGQGSPTVVFDCFGPANLEIWNRVQPEVARFTRTVTFDHGGYWGSQPGPKPRDARQLAGELHAALDHANLAPPYLLVGYSFGGPYARVFAGLYPNEVAGLVLADPTQEEFMDWLRKHWPKLNKVSEKHRLAQGEWGCQWDSMDQARASILPDVPITLITGMKPHDLFTRKILPRWLEAHQRWLTQFPQANHIVTTNSGHNLVLAEPELVINAIRETAKAIPSQSKP